jgi:hypothetical protein
MKKIILAIALLSGVASAQACCYRGGYYHHGYYGGGGWVAPALIGGVIGYELARPPVVVEQQPILVQPAPIVVQQPNVQYAPPPVGYHYQQMVNPQTNQYQLVLVPN